MTIDRSTAALVADAQGGDRAAFDELVSRYRDRLSRQIRSRLGERVGSRVEIDDILQETVSRAFEAVGKFRWQGEESFYRWLGSIAEHLIWNVSQKKSLDRLELKTDVPARDATPSREARRSERFDRLEEAINRLNPDQREALKLARLEGVKVREIAVRMNRSTKAVYALLSRALDELKESFGDTESLHLPDRILEVKERADEE